MAVSSRPDRRLARSFHRQSLKILTLIFWQKLPLNHLRIVLRPRLANRLGVDLAQYVPILPDRDKRLVDVVSARIDDLYQIDTYK